MSDYSSTIDGSNKIIVPFEFKLGNLEQLQNVLEQLHAAAEDLPPEAKEGMEIPQKGGRGTPSKKSDLSPLAEGDIDATDEATRQAIHDDLKEQVDDLAAELEPGEIEKKLKGALEKLGGAEFGVGEGMQMLMNPRGFIMGLLSNPAVAAALLTAGFGMAMLEIAMMQSAPLDKHFRRIVTDEFIKMVRPLQRRQTQVGIGRQVIFTSESGSTQPQLAINSYDVLRRGEINQIESWQIRKGYKW